MKLPTDTPIFFDHRGRRWKIIRLVLLSLLIVAAFMSGYVLPKAWRHDSVRPFNNPAYVANGQPSGTASGLSPSAVAALAGQTNTPVIGSGPLVQVVQVRQTAQGMLVVPLYTSLGGRQLSEAERLRVGDHGFAIERYGKVSVPRQIALTFDDGPDATYTPQILDILARHKIQATFFVTGANVVKHPDIARREVREGHLVANHTFTHLDFDLVSSLRGEQEINQTQRVIKAATGTRSSFFRLPYMGVDEQSMRDHLLGILTAQRMGYTVASNEYDSSDWGFETGTKPQLPKLDGSSLVVLLHDAGGDRSRTIAYVEQLVQQARSRGYQFVNLNQMYTQQPALYATAAVGAGDRASLALASLALVWPQQLIGKLFVVTVATLLLTLVVNALLASLNVRRSRFKRRPASFRPLVSVLVPAYNEEKVLANTVRSLLHANYRHQEIIIIDDGSTDGTYGVARQLARRHKRVRAFAMAKNSGKAAALNFGLRHADGEVVIIVDADTIFPPTTLGRLIRHFHDPAVGAVAGNVKVGNVGNLVTRWQALDYAIGINVERNAQAFLGAVMIVPGACGAWRRQALQAAGGYSHHTLAEDFDLTLSVQRLGYKIVQDNSAYSYTEAPETVRALARQRFRWMYGNVQSYWKHRDMIFRRRYGWAGMFVLPAAVFTFVIPILFVPILVFVAAETLLAGNGLLLLAYFAITLAIQTAMAVIAIRLAGERWSLLLAIPLTRLMYTPMRTWLMYRTVLNIMRGVAVGWNKLHRTGAVQYRRAIKGAGLSGLSGAVPAGQLQPVPQLAEQSDSSS